MKLIDTHCHLTFDKLTGDVEGVLSRSVAAGVTGWITIGTEPGELQKALALTESHENLWVGLGFHPHIAKEISDDDLKFLEKLAGENDKIVAIGETGLDYHYDHSPRDIQQLIFRGQLQIAQKLNLPVIVHSREAFDDTMSILDEFTGGIKNVVIHCYSGTCEQTRLILEAGYYISFTGIVTFKKSDQARAAAKLVPLDRLMIETDCPFMSPEPVRNERPCEPAMMIHIAKKLAEVKEMDLENFSRAVTSTSKNFFNLPSSVKTS